VGEERKRGHKAGTCARRLELAINLSVVISFSVEKVDSVDFPTQLFPWVVCTVVYLIFRDCRSLITLPQQILLP
jgi:hypothetical protein